MAEDTDYEVRRQFPRVPFSRTPWVFALKLDSDELAMSPLQLEAQNISLGGLRFLANKKIAIFSKVSIQLLDKEGKKTPITAQGKVVRVDETDLGLEEKTFGMSIEFTSLPEKTLDAIQSELSRVQKKAAKGPAGSATPP